MSLGSYKKYKDSGITWLRKIPEHWEIKRIKDIFNLTRGKFTHRPRNDAQMYDNGIYPFIQTGDISKSSKYVDSYKQTLNEEGIKVSRKFKKGTILMTIAANIGDVSILGFDAYFPDSIVGFITNYNKDYFYYLLSTTKNELDTVKVTNTQDNLNLERLNALFKVVPLDNEQTQIANYLDNKTKAIDKKTKFLEQKIQKYKELRKSIINKVVTKGLDTNVKLKDSGIDWIGEIPMYWEVKRLKELGTISTSSVNKKIEEDESLVKLVNYTDVYNNLNKELWAKSNYMKVSAKLNQIIEKSLKKGDVLFTPSSETIEDIGVSSVVMENLSNTLYSYHVLRLRFVKLLDDNFKKYMLNNDFVQLYFSQSSKGTTRKILGLNDFSNLKVLIPPFKEQIQIAQYLDNKTTTIDSIIQNIEKQIEVLAELRKTLINDVVTGKLCVLNN